MTSTEHKTEKKKSSANPEKLVYKLDEVSRITKMDRNTIESWEQEFYFIQSGRTGTGHKIFRQKDLAIILRLKELLENEGLTLAGAKRKLEEELGIKNAAAVHPDRLKKILYNVRQQLKDIASCLKD